MRCGQDDAATMLNVEVQHAHDDDTSSTIVSFATSATATATAAPTIMDHVKQHQYQQQQKQHQQRRLASDGNEEKKEEDVPSNHHHHHHNSFAAPSPMLSLYSLQHGNVVDSHHVYANSILSNGSMEDEDDEEDEVDDIILNVIKTTADDSSTPQRSIQTKNNIPNSSPTNTNRITLNTHNSILSISEDEDEEEEGDNTTTVNSDSTMQSKATHPPPEKEERVPDQFPLQLPPVQQHCHHHHQRASPSSCLMDNDDEEDEDDDEDDYDDHDDDERDGSFASIDLGVDHVHVMTTGCSDHAEIDGCTKNHQVPLTSSSIENINSSPPPPPPPSLAATQNASSTPATANTTPCRQHKTTSASASSSCIPQTPTICTRSWCGEATTTTATTPATGMVVTSPVLVATPTSSVAQLPLATTDAAQQQQPLLPPHLPCSDTTTGTTTILMKSPRGGRGFFDTMTEHFVDSLCFPRDDSSIHRTCSTSTGVAAAAAAVTTTTTTTTNSQSPPQEQYSTPNNGAAATAHTAPHDLSGSAATYAATDTSTNSAAEPPSTSNAIYGSGGTSSWTSPLFGPSANSGSSSSSSDDQRSLCLQDHIMVLLGCANSPNDDEMQKVWAWNQSILECPRKTSDDDSLFHPRAATCGNVSLQCYNHHQQYQYHGGRRRPRRRDLHERAIRVHQLRTERGMPCYNKKPLLGRMKQMLFAPPVSTVTKTTSTSSTTTTTTTSPTSVTANSQMDWSSSRYQQQQQQQQEKTHYGNLPMMMDDSTLFAAEYHEAHCNTRCVGTDGNNGENIMKTSLPLRRSSRSMDDRILQQECKNDPLRKSKLEEHLNRRWAPILYQEEDYDIGYDSDPGGLDIYTTATSPTTTPSAATRQHKVIQNKTQQQRLETASGLSLSTSTTSSSNSLFGQPLTHPPQPLWDANVIETVQESLNMSWNLTWHPGNNVDANGNNNNSRKIRIWIERGTIINSAKVMLEPNIMWRDCYQPEMSKQRKLNVCMQKSSQTQAASASSSSTTTIPPQAVVRPFTIRLLSVCRVLEAPLHDALDRSLYPLARPSCSFLLKTAAPDGKEYLFEAATTAERDVIIHRWKVCIARFAALAVMEDLDAICREFFAPAITSRMLVPDDYHW